MTVFAAAAALLLGSLNLVTAPRIEAARDAARNAHLVELTGSPGPFELLGASDGVRTVRDAAHPERTVLLATAAGYGGPIEIGVVLDASGAISAVTTLRHQETPGLGDFIESRRSPWSRQFLGRRDLTGVDGRTGASITARAFTRAVEAALRHTTVQASTVDD